VDSPISNEGESVDIFRGFKVKHFLKCTKVFLDATTTNLIMFYRGVQSLKNNFSLRHNISFEVFPHFYEIRLLSLSRYILCFQNNTNKF
jgi:hypothetical protein